MTYKIAKMQDFCVGDMIKIVDAPYMKCAYSWIRSMDKYCGREAVIIKASFDAIRNCYRYHIDADNGAHAWCKGCFEQVLPDIEESALDICALFQ